MKKYCLVNGRILTPYKEITGHILEVTGKKVSDIIPEKKFTIQHSGGAYDEIIDVKGKIIAPGFIDVHNHGGRRINYFQLNQDSIEESTLHHATGGTTSFLVTTGPAPYRETVENLREIKKALEKPNRGSRVLGINMEGPYLNQKYGAQKNNTTCVPVKKEYVRIVHEAMPYLKVMSVAPEIKGSRELIKYLDSQGIIISIGHTEASKAEVDFAVLHGAKLITHIFNAMGQPVQVEAGVKPVGTEEYLLAQDRLMAEVMADKFGAHVDPVFLRMLLDVKGKDKIILITDSIFNAGLPSGEYPAGDGRIFIGSEGDINRLKGNGVIAGSVMTMNRAVTNMIKHTGISLKDAVQMATINPAKLLCVDGTKGSISAGMDADIIVIDGDIKVYMTIVEGEVAYRRSVS